MDPKDHPIETTYGMNLQTTIIRMVLDLKANPKDIEITSVYIAEKIKQEHPELKEVFKSKRQRTLFLIRIRKCLKALVKTKQLMECKKKTPINTTYYAYKIV